MISTNLATFALISPGLSTARSVPTRSLGAPLWDIAGAVPSLDLNLAENKSLVDSVTGQSLVTFTRAGGGAYTDSAAIIRTAATNEPRFDHRVTATFTNLLLWSEDFNNPVWSATNGVVTANFTTSPAGTLTADRFTENTGSVDPRFPVSVSLVAGAAYTLSVYAKVIPGSAQRYLMLVFNTGFSSVVGANFNLVTGAVGATNGASGSIQSVGNGWYRCSITPSSNATGSGSFRIRTCAVDNLGNITSPATYTGDGLSGFDFFGAQLEQSSTAGPYFPTTTVPASVTTTESLGLLVEEQRTNLLTYTELFNTSPWAPGALAVASTVATTAPSGGNTAIRLTENTAAGAFHFLNYILTKAASAIQYTYSIYGKAGERELIFSLASGATGVVARFNLATGVITAPASAYGGGFTAQGSTITAAGNGWYRCSLTFTTDATTGLTVQHALYNTALATNVYTGDGTSGIFIWGAQLEAGAFATTYISAPGAAAVTRAADVASITGTNFSSWYRQDEGTFFEDVVSAPVNTIAQVALDTSDASGNERMFARRTAAGSFAFAVVDNVTTQADVGAGSAIPGGSRFSATVAYRLNSINAAVGGQIGTEDTAATIPTPDRLFIGQNFASGQHVNGCIRRLIFWPVRFINTVLQSISQ